MIVRENTSAIELIDRRSGRSYPAASGDAVILSSVRQGWRSPLVFEVHRMMPHAYEEHQLVGHRLIVNLGSTVRFGWKRGDRNKEASLHTGGFCLQSEGETNAPFWRDEMTFAAVAIPASLVDTLLESRAPRPCETFMERRCVQESVAYRYARSLAGELSSPSEPLYAEVLSHAFTLHLLAAHGVSKGRKQLAPKGKLGAAQLSAVLELAHERLAENLSLEMLASAAGYSPFQFSRLFKATTGVAPHQFILKLRLERAQRMLRSKGSTLAEIAVASGFYDQAHLTNVFRRQIGLSPGAFLNLWTSVRSS